MAGAGKVAVVVGASRGVGYSIGKEMACRLPNAKIKLTTEGQANLQVFKKLLANEIGANSRNCDYRQLELKESRGISKLVEVIKHKHHKVDILVNAASIYYKPPASHHSYGVPEVNEAYVKEAKQCIRTNYLAFKEVFNHFLPIMAQHSRIVNVGSHLGMVRNIPSRHLREAFAQPNITEKQLDELIENFLSEIKRGTHESEGWPTCAYTVSKIAINSYTGILQRRLDTEMADRQIVANCVNTGSNHEKMKMKQLTLDTVAWHQNSAAAVAYLATYGMPDVPATLPEAATEGGLAEMPKGKIFWSSLQEVDWSAERKLATKSSVN